MAESILTLTIADSFRIPAQLAEDLFNTPSDEATFRAALDRYLKGVLTGQIPTGISARLCQANSAATKVASTVTIDQSKQTDGDTISFGTQTFTWKTSPSGESQVDIGADSATSASNLESKINNHSSFGHVIRASAASNVVTVEWYGDPLAGALIAITKSESTSGSMTLSDSSFVAAGLGAAGGIPVSYTRGV